MIQRVQSNWCKLDEDPQFSVGNFCNPRTNATTTSFEPPVQIDGKQS